MGVRFGGARHRQLRRNVWMLGISLLCVVGTGSESLSLSTDLSHFRINLMPNLMPVPSELRRTLGLACLLLHRDFWGSEPTRRRGFAFALPVSFFTRPKHQTLSSYR